MGSGGGGLEHGVDRGGIDGAALHLDVAVGRDHGEGGLGGDAVLGEDLSVRIGDLREGESELVDERLERGLVAVPGDADQVGPSGPSCTCLLDRGGFAPAGESTRRPEPEGERLVGQGRDVEGSASDERNGAPGGSADGAGIGGPRRNAGSRVGRRPRGGDPRSDGATRAGCGSGVGRVGGTAGRSDENGGGEHQPRHEPRAERRGGSGRHVHTVCRSGRPSLTER